MDRLFASSSTAAESARQLSSIDDVQRWLTTLTEVTSTQQLESLRAAVKMLTKPEFKRDDARALCKIWPVKRDDGKIISSVTLTKIVHTHAQRTTHTHHTPEVLHKS